MLIPDSIEPVVGWRCFRVVDGFLHSPQRNTMWLPKKELTAECEIFALPHASRGVTIYTPPPFQVTGSVTSSGVGFSTPMTGGSYAGISWVTSGVSGWVNTRYPITAEYEWQLLPNFVVQQPVPKEISDIAAAARPDHLEIPSDWKWVIMRTQEPEPEFKHIAPVEKCSCGIYIVQSLQQTVPYAHQGVVARVAGWGKVIPATLGWRVQYAYPQELYALRTPASELKDYGIPVEDLSDLEEKYPEESHVVDIFRHRSQSRTAPIISLTTGSYPNLVGVRIKRKRKQRSLFQRSLVRIAKIVASIVSCLWIVPALLILVFPVLFCMMLEVFFGFNFNRAVDNFIETTFHIIYWPWQLIWGDLS